MDIHKPKPWHGVRELLKEIGTIVIGVLIALGGEQAVEWTHQQTELSEAREALHNEVVEGATDIRVAALEDRCLMGLLDRYEAWAKGGPKPPMPAPSMLPVPDDAVWESLRAGAVTRMPLKERLTYVRYFYQAANNRSLYYPMREHAITMRTYLAWDTLTPAEARTLLRDIARGRTQLGVMLRNEPYELEAAKAAGGEPQPLTPARRATLEAECAAAGVPFDDKGP